MLTEDISVSRIPQWVRIGLVALGIPNVLTGVWAVAAPDSWFDKFPGWDPRLVAAEPPFNAHLATDAGAGLLASGVVLLGAAWLADRRTTQLALVAFAAFAIPHAGWHALNPSDQLTAAEDAQNIAVLVLSAVIALALLFGSRSEVRGSNAPTEEEAST